MLLTLLCLGYFINLIYGDSTKAGNSHPFSLFKWDYKTYLHSYISASLPSQNLVIKLSLITLNLNKLQGHNKVFNTNTVRFFSSVVCYNF